MGLEVAPTVTFTWKSKAPLRCRFFAWLALQDRCWTFDRLARRGLDHQEACPFCDQEEESINHILLQCVFAREVWASVCAAWDIPSWAPTPTSSLGIWCLNATDGAVGGKDARAMLLLVLWELWKHRNRVGFDGEAPAKSFVINRSVVECRAWKAAGLFRSDIDSAIAALEVGNVASR